MSVQVSRESPPRYHGMAQITRSVTSVTHGVLLTDGLGTSGMHLLCVVHVCLLVLAASPLLVKIILLQSDQTKRTTAVGSTDVRPPESESEGERLVPREWTVKSLLGTEFRCGKMRPLASPQQERP